jgi:effector-binding domain-containing protein
MKKKVVLLVLLAIVIIACFIPITEEKTITINASFFNVYRVLSTPAKWKEWRSDLKRIPIADTAKISIFKDTGFFAIKFPKLLLRVKTLDGVFNIDDYSNNRNVKYSYFAIPAKALNTTVLSVDKRTSAIVYLFQRFDESTFADTHINDLKTFMETDSLKYGCVITKTRVPEANLVVIDETVAKKDKFTEAEKMLSQLQEFVRKHNLKQTQPVIAQYFDKPKTDSTQLKVGIFIDQETVSENNVVFTRMPKGGPLYVAKFNGKFEDRVKIYTGLQQYFTDHLYQQAILPFEFYLDNKLPASDSDKVNIQVNFSTFF